MKISVKKTVIDVVVAMLLLHRMTVMTAAQEVCAEGLVMDWLCIQRGTLLDPEGTPTFVHPEVHTVHCLVDVPMCLDSGFALLKDPDVGSNANYTVAYNLDKASNAMILALLQEHGQCDTCRGTIVHGFRAGVRGTLVNASGDSLLSITEAVVGTPDYCTNLTHMAENSGTLTSPDNHNPTVAPVSPLQPTTKDSSAVIFHGLYSFLFGAIWLGAMEAMI